MERDRFLPLGGLCSLAAAEMVLASIIVSLTICCLRLGLCLQHVARTVVAGDGASRTKSCVGVGFCQRHHRHHADQTETGIWMYENKTTAAVVQLKKPQPPALEAPFPL